MAEAVKASFQFERFKIPNFTYNESTKAEVTLNLVLTPKGYYNKGEFMMELNLVARDNDDLESIILTVKSVAFFKFESDLQLKEIPPFFYQNAIAIVFPYLRAFISNLTLQANTGLIILGLLNLSNLQDEFISNTVEASKS